MRALLFEDEAVTQLYPITVGRPAFAISCGSLRLIDLWSRDDVALRVVVRPHLAAIVEADFKQFLAVDDASTTPDDEPTLLVNARLTPSVGLIDRLIGWAKETAAGQIKHGDDIAVARLPQGAPPPPDNLRFDQVEDYLSYVGVPTVEAPFEVPLLDYPHDVVRQHMRVFAENLNFRLAGGEYKEVEDGVFLAAGARLGQHVVCNSSDGPIVLEAGATVGPHSYLAGPIHLGAKCRVLEHASIKDAVALGHTTKIGGEVEASIIEPYTNKQHHGFLGHSYLGSWINLGAGTCNSDLKNTYGNVKMEYRNRRVSTGMQFVGCFLGDYAKSAINTSIFTGKVIGACSMVYGFVTTNVPSFVNYARSFGQVTELPPEVMISTQQRMFARRDVEQRPCDIQLLRDMYELTRDERRLAGEPLTL